MQMVKKSNNNCSLSGIRNVKRSSSNSSNSSGICLLITLMLTLLVLLQQMQPCECRYLPTRSHGDDLDKLRELMLQILESSNEENLQQPQQQPLLLQQQQQQQMQQQQPHLTNDMNGGNSVAQRATWLNKLDGAYDGMDALPRKYHRRSMFDNDRFY